MDGAMLEYAQRLWRVFRFHVRSPQQPGLSLADKKAALESMVRRNARIEGISIFFDGNESAFLDEVRGCSSDEHLRALQDRFAARYRAAEGVVLQSFRAYANLI
jgi:hypothetical protein